MTKESYEMIEGQVGARGAAVEGEMGSLLPGATPARKGLLAACMGTVVAIALLVGCVAATSPSVSARDPASDAAAAAQTTPMQASTNSVPSCSLTSCTNSGCNWDSAPFFCVDGGSVGGCAEEASTWSGGDGCTSFCDLSGCADALEKAGSGADGAGDLPRHCVDCDESQCSKVAGQSSQACGEAAPFVCLSGAATWGCADKALAWASAPSTTCGECCDVSAC